MLTKEFGQLNYTAIIKKDDVQWKICVEYDYYSC